jgi:hypothetical protein
MTFCGQGEKSALVHVVWETKTASSKERFSMPIPVLKAKHMLVLAVAILGLSGCVAYPDNAYYGDAYYGTGYYGSGYYGGPYYYGPPVSGTVIIGGGPRYHHYHHWR